MSDCEGSLDPYHPSVDCSIRHTWRVSTRDFDYTAECRRLHDKGEMWKEKCVLADGAMRELHRKLIKAEKEKEELNKVIRESRFKYRKSLEITSERQRNEQSQHQCIRRRTLDNSDGFKKLQVENKIIKRSAVERANKLRQADKKIHVLEENIATLEEQLNQCNVSKAQKDKTFSDNDAVEGCPHLSKDKIRVLRLSVKSDMNNLLKLKLTNMEVDITNLKAQFKQEKLTSVSKSAVENWLTLKVSEQQKNENSVKSVIRGLQEEAAELRNLLKRKLHEVKNSEDRLKLQQATMENIKSDYEHRVIILQNDMKDLDQELTIQKHNNQCLANDLAQANTEKNDAMNMWQVLNSFIKNDELDSILKLTDNKQDKDERLKRNLQTMSDLCLKALQKINATIATQNDNRVNMSARLLKEPSNVKEKTVVADSFGVVVKQEIANEPESSSANLFQQLQQEYLPNCPFKCSPISSDEDY